MPLNVGHTAGEPIECFGIPIVLHKEADIDSHGNPAYDVDGKQKFRCGFKIGGGIDQDPSQSPQGYPDKGIYITFVYEGGPAHHAGLQVHDKVLQANGHDMTVVTHKKAVEYIKRKSVLNMLVYRKGMPSLPPQQQQQQQQQKPMMQEYSAQNVAPAPQGFPPQQQYQQEYSQFQPVHQQQAPGSPHAYQHRQY